MSQSGRLVIPNHAHCTRCGRAIPVGEKICGPECQAATKKDDKQRRKHMLILYGLMFVGVILLFVAPLLQQR